VKEEGQTCLVASAHVFAGVRKVTGCEIRVRRTYRGALDAIDLLAEVLHFSQTILLC
jgi:hypothetical protein